MVHIPYKSSAETNTALLGGHVDAISDVGWLSLAEAGKLLPILMYADKRYKKFPQIPTAQEAYNVLCTAGIGLMGPKSLPKPIVKKIHDVFQKALDDPDYQAFIEKYGMETIYLDSEDYEKFVRQESERTKIIIQKLGLQKK